MSIGFEGLSPLSTDTLTYMHTKGVGAELREKQPPTCMVVWYNKRHTNKYEKHFPKMYRDVGMAVPKTTQTRYMDGTVQATQRTTQVTPSLHHFFNRRCI